MSSYSNSATLRFCKNKYDDYVAFLAKLCCLWHAITVKNSFYKESISYKHIYVAFTVNVLDEQNISIYLPIMSNPCWGPRHMRVKLQGRV